MDALIGKKLANFRLERLLGRGGMASVYLAQDVTLQRPVAVKVINVTSYRSKPERFVQEARTVATWKHENIAQVYYADKEGDLYYFAMEYIDGLDVGKLLAQYAKEGELMPIEDVLHIGRSVAEALDYAHSKHIIHRDVKPSNIMVSTANQVVLMDFGLALDAREGTMGEVFGSPHYIAPEQARNSADAVPQSDLYALGVILYEMLTGQVPFDDPSATTLAIQHLTKAPPPPRQINPNINSRTEAVLLKALSKAPDKRYARGKTLMDALEKALKSSPSSPARARAVLPPTPAGARKLSRVTVSNRMEAFAREHHLPIPIRQAKSRKARTGSRRLRMMIVMAFLAVLATVGIYSQIKTAPSSENTPTLAAPTTQSLVEGGKPLTLLYDVNSFYILNQSEFAVPVDPLVFERVGGEENRFEGKLWREFYPRILAGWCMSLEIRDQEPHLEPEECGGRYNSALHPFSREVYFFWTPQDGSTHFKVLWEEREVALCEISAGKCEIFLP